MVLDAPLLNTQHYKVGITGKVEQSRERSCTPSTLVMEVSLRDVTIVRDETGDGVRGTSRTGSAQRFVEN